jgi:hypothetical protein
MMLSSSKIHIAQLQLQLLEASALRMYKASWLKNVDEVARDQGGKFASKAGGAIATANLPDAKAIQKAGLTPVINSDGSGTSLFATTTIDGKQFFLKEVQSKRTISSGRRSWEVKSPYGAEREEIGGDVARLLGLENHVIPTKKVELDGKKYTVAPFTAGDPFWDVHFHDVSLPKKAKLIEDKLGPRAKQAILLDFLLDNRDRHAGNTYITKDGGLKLIDHEFILSKRKEGDKTSPLKGVMKDYVQGKHQAGSPVEFAEAELQDAIGKRADIVKLIKKRLPADEAKEAIEVLDGRIDYLKTMIDNKELGAYQMAFSADELKMMQEGTGVMPSWANSPASATQPMNAPASATQPINAPASATRPISETGSLGTAPISVISRKPRRIPSMSETAPMSSNATATL